MVKTPSQTGFGPVVFAFCHSPLTVAGAVTELGKARTVFPFKIGPYLVHQSPSFAICGRASAQTQEKRTAPQTTPFPSTRAPESRGMLHIRGKLLVHQQQGFVSLQGTACSLISRDACLCFQLREKLKNLRALCRADAFQRLVPRLKTFSPGAIG